MAAVYPKGKSATFYLQKQQTQHRKNEVSEMIESKNTLNESRQHNKQQSKAKQRGKNCDLGKFNIKPVRNVIESAV